MMNRYSFREAFVIRHLEALHVVTLQLVYKINGEPLQSRLVLKNVAFPVTGFPSTSY